MFLFYYYYSNIMIVLSVVLITLTCVAIRYYIRNYCCLTYVIRNENILPGPKKYMAKYLYGNPDELLNILCILGKYFTSPFQLLKTPFVVIYEPNQVKTVLKSRHCLDKNIIFYKFAEEIFGTKLLTAPESIWNQNRKRIAPGFSLNMLQRFFNTFVEESLMLTNKLEKVGVNGNEIIFFEHIATCALDIACSTIMGIKMESNKKDQYFKTVMRSKEILRYRLYSVWNESWFDKIIFNFTTLGREQQKTSKLMHSLINELIQQQLHELNKTEMETNTNKTFFNILMEASHKKNFTQEMIRDNVITMITLEKVYKELKTIYGTETLISAPVKYDDLQHMHYMDQVIKETIRLFPTTPIIGRRLTEDVKIGNFILPKNTSIIIILILMNRQEQYWPNPLKFDPDRFLPERIKDCLSDYHIPFSDGPRNCIGTKYAMISIKVILATLIRTFVLKVDKSIQIHNIKLKTDVTLSTIEPLKIRIKKRDLQ
ncbi:PREDICTED: cytochrome P450 4V2-like isoform X2 [Acromyrmex echinatior]|uniref:cytochrome P450 4V2-like isoform X2 n=1 Tax=Acromyrmex echinatior TaxID=103372 RepID=UPI000580CDF8|nr:PREDICTED: cytochrome P450 4V2-like isoform X2 [Acromyrmex echinatior]